MPSLTTAAIKRVKEGVGAAGDVYDGLRLRAVRQIIEKTLNRLEAISQGHSEPRANSGLRRFVMRALIHSFFKVTVEHLERIPHKHYELRITN
ncbi:hypothetical protein [Nostoc sp.]|uniref:hypothetical protein n=1 Tax=Nostoc sp. TaxID=1180 RepID=UPI002FFC35A7